MTIDSRKASDYAVVERLTMLTREAKACQGDAAETIKQLLNRIETLEADELHEHLSDLGLINYDDTKEEVAAVLRDVCLDNAAMVAQTASLVEAVRTLPRYVQMKMNPDAATPRWIPIKDARDVVYVDELDAAMLKLNIFGVNDDE